MKIPPNTKHTHHRVLDRHVGPLPHVRQRGVRGIAHQDHAALVPEGLVGAGVEPEVEEARVGGAGQEGLHHGRRRVGLLPLCVRVVYADEIAWYVSVD